MISPVKLKAIRNYRDVIEASRKADRKTIADGIVWRRVKSQKPPM